MGILNRNKKKEQKRGKGMGIGLADHGRRSPMGAEEQDAPQPERLTRPDEEAGTAVHEMQDPPKAEGERT